MDSGCHLPLRGIAPIFGNQLPYSVYRYPYTDNRYAINIQLADTEPNAGSTFPHSDRSLHR